MKGLGFMVAIFFLALVSTQNLAALDFLKVCETGSAAEVKKALQSGANLAAKDKDGNGPLMIAAAHNNSLDVISTLHKAGVKLRDKNSNGMTALHLAASYSKNPEIVRYLVSQGLDVNTFDQSGGGSPLAYAARYNHEVSIFDVLLELGARAKIDDYYGYWPLRVAAIWYIADVVERLLKAGGSPTEGSKYDWMSPVLAAASYNPSIEVLKAMLEHGATVNSWYSGDAKVGRQPWSPLGAAAQLNPNPGILDYIVQNGGVPAANENRDLVWRACLNNPSPKPALWLIEHGYTAYGVDKNGVTSFQIANSTNVVNAGLRSWKRSEPGVAKQVETLLKTANFPARGGDPVSGGGFVWYPAIYLLDLAKINKPAFEVEESPSTTGVTIVRTGGQKRLNFKFPEVKDAVRPPFLTGVDVTLDANAGPRDQVGILLRRDDPKDYVWISINASREFQVTVSTDGVENVVVPWKSCAELSTTGTSTNLLVYQWEDRLDFYANGSRVLVLPDLSAGGGKATIELVLGGESGELGSTQRATLEHVEFRHISDAWEYREGQMVRVTQF